MTSATVESGASKAPGPAWMTVKRCFLPPTFTTRLAVRSDVPVFASAANTMPLTSRPPLCGETVSHSGMVVSSKAHCVVADTTVLAMPPSSGMLK